MLQLLVTLQDKETYCYRERYDNNNNKFKQSFYTGNCATTVSNATR